MEPCDLMQSNGEAHHPLAAPLFVLAGDSPPKPGLQPATPFHRRKGRAWLFGMGGTILSGVGFVALALFEQYNGMLTELRNDLKHFNETSGDYVKKDNMQRLRDQLHQYNRDVQATNAGRLQLEQELKFSEKARDEMTHAMQQMRERLSYLEGRQAAAVATGPARAKK